MSNPLLSDWTTPYGLPPYSAISDADYAAAFDAAMAEDLAQVQTVANNPDPATFENTIEGLMRTGALLDQVAGAFYSVAGADSNDAREAIMREFSPKFAAHSSAIYSNKKLFDRIRTVWEARDSLSLNDEQNRVLMLMHRNFVRAGAALEGEGEARMKAIKSRLAELGTSFTQNLLADERDWFMELAEDDLEGLPDFVIDAVTQAGKDREMGPVVTLSRSVITPFLQFSPRRDLRQKAQAAWAARGANGGATDNREIAAETLALREERAQLLGYKDFAAYKLETEMAGNPDNVRDLLMKVWGPAKAQALKDAEILEAMMREDGINGPLETWDWRYYSEKRRKVEHDLDEAEVKPYFQLDKMIEASFDCASKLFGLSFQPLDVDLYHPDCRAWEVLRDGKVIAVFIGDYFARSSKRSGAWCSAIRAQRKFPDVKIPLVINVCNFAKSDPALLSYDDARTLFHEFGHALHQMLSDVTYEMISGTSVARDFVELPSQLYEHWLDVPEVLGEFATHAQTGEAMPKALLDKVLGAATYDMGFQTVEYVASALVDLEFHNGAVPSDVMAKQTEVLDGLGMPHAIGMRHATPQFAHVFSGDGYSSGYYSYMWSEVMDADAFEAFEEAGSAFDPATAEKLENFILSAGGSQDAESLYKQFRGRMPGVQALLKGRGLAA